MERNALKGNSGMDMLFSAIEREQSRSSSSAKHRRADLYSQSVSAAEKGKEQTGSHLHTNNALQAGSFPNPLNGYPLATYGQSPFLWPYLSSPMRAPARLTQPLIHAEITAPKAVPSATRGELDLQCALCGLACATPMDLSDHIMRKHIPTVAELDKNMLNLQHLKKKDSVSSSHDNEDSSYCNTPPRKDSAESSNSRESDKNSSSDFPIPTPNFALFSSYSTLPSLSSPIGSSSFKPGNDIAKVFPDGFLPSYVYPQLKAMPFPILPNAYGMLNPLLAYQNMVNTNDLISTAPISKFQQAGKSTGAAASLGYPYLESLPKTAYFPGNLPFLPNVPLMTPPATINSAAAESVNPKTNTPNENAMLENATEMQNEPSKNFANLPSSHAESLRRRRSVPSIHRNKEFRAPYPYSRKPNNSNPAPNVSLPECKEASSEEMRRSTNELAKKRNSVPEKPIQNRPSAKSIEQHISKLISNNEKVLLNPVLERVKPRRVFRRNSIDSASLSSYAAPGCSSQDGSFQNEDEAARVSKILTSNSDTVLGYSTSNMFLPSSISNFTAPPGMTSLEYESMIQLKRAPKQNRSNSIANDDIQRHGAGETQQMEEKHNIESASIGILGKRDPSATESSHLHAKRPRRSTFFECSDCGVRYRKEENYNIHKQMYCKYKKLIHKAMSEDKLKLQKTDQRMLFRRHSYVPEVSRTSIADAIFEKYSFDDASANANPGKDLLLVNGLPSGNSIGFLDDSKKVFSSTSQLETFVNPMKVLHNDLCRTKSAEATLQAESVMKTEEGLQSGHTNAPAKPVKSNSCHQSIELNHSAESSPTLSPSQTRLSQAPSSTIPANKLPPNKRHLMRHFEQGVSASEPNEMVITDSTGTSFKNDTAAVGPVPRTAILDKSRNSFFKQEATSAIVSSTSAIKLREEVPSAVACSNEFNFDETFVPRSNYKLLLHQISLRNMQDMELMENFPRNKSVWSWQQIRKGLAGHKALDSSTSSSFDTRKANPPHHRKFSVPPRLPKISEVNRNMESSMSTKSSTLKTSLATVESTSQVQKLLSPSPQKLASMYSITGLSLEKNAEAVSNCNNVDKTILPISVDFLKTPSMNISEEAVVTSTLTTKQSTEYAKSSPVIKFENNSGLKEFGTDKVPDSKNEKEETSEKVENFDEAFMAATLYPHLKPTLTAQAHVSYCCMVCPQPTCMELSMSDDSKSTQLSMYSDWAISEPLLIPSELTIADVLTCWRRSRAGYSKGLTTMVKDSSEFLLTESKAFKKLKKDLQKDKEEKIDVSKRTGEKSCKDEAVETLKNNEEVEVPVLLPSLLFRSTTDPIYARCHQTQGTSSLPADSSITVAGSQGDTKDYRVAITNGTTSCSTVNTKKKEVKSKDNDLVPSWETNEADNLSGENSQSSFKEEEKESPRILSDRSSCRITDSDSDPVDVRIEYFGKVKRRRTRKERTAASPREKRRALQCTSPSSPSALPVHKGNACSNATEEKLRGCSLCSIKAGRADLITETNSPCQPCRDAARKDKHSTMISQNPITPLYISPPVTTSSFLDKARASTGNTQHWVSNCTPDPEATPHGAVFRYPSPRSSKSSASDGLVETTLIRSPSRSPFRNPISSKTEKSQLLVDVSKACGTSPKSAASSPSVVSPSLAEVVSEVMRTAAMQSKRRSKASNRHRLLSKSRALLPVKQSATLMTEQCNGHGGIVRQNGDAAAQCSTMSSSLTSVNSTSFTYPENELQGDTHFASGRSAAGRVDPCQITVTPATPPSPKPGELNPAMESASDVFHNAEKSIKSDSFEKTNVMNSFVSNEVSMVIGERLAEQRVQNGEQNHLIPMMQSACPNQEVETSQKDDDSFESDDDAKVDVEDSRSAEGKARPYRCEECRVAFRISGHLAKHLRSKGHTVAMQKKTLNRFKMWQIQMCVSGNNAPQPSAETDTYTVTISKENSPSQDAVVVPNSVHGQINSNGGNGSEFLDGAEGLARSQVRALLEGSGEYACVPSVTCDDAVRGEVADDVTGSQDSRPFKCIACKIAFRFQGHLDRHFRSNAHLIAVGHYEQDMSLSVNRTAQSHHCNDGGITICDKKENLATLGDMNNNPTSLPASPSPASYQVDNELKNSMTYDHVTSHPNSSPSPSEATLLQSRKEFVFPPPKSETGSGFTSQIEKYSVQALNERITSDEQKSSCFEATGSNLLSNHQSIPQLHITSNDKSVNGGTPLRSSDCVSRGVAMSCT